LCSHAANLRSLDSVTPARQKNIKRARKNTQERESQDISESTTQIRTSCLFLFGSSISAQTTMHRPCGLYCASTVIYKFPLTPQKAAGAMRSGTLNSPAVPGFFFLSTEGKTVEAIIIHIDCLTVTYTALSIDRFRLSISARNQHARR
jgi:hypothetical protein